MSRRTVRLLDVVSCDRLMTSGVQKMPDDLQEQLDAFEGLSTGPPVVAPDPVNQPMIRHMVEALGDTNPIYVDADAARAVGHPDVVAPPTMMQTWSMPGIRGHRRAGEGSTGRDVVLNL